MAGLCGVVAGLCPVAAWAEPAAGAAATAPDAARKAEARDRFEQGLRLFDEGDTAGALAEFQRAYALIPTPVLLFNIGLVHAASGRSVEAVEALDAAILSGALAPAETERALRVRTDQQRRVGTLGIELSEPGAVIEVDGVPRGKTPLDGPLRVAGGQHVVEITLTGYLPYREQVSVAGGETRTIAVTLRPLARSQGALAVTSRVLEAEVRVDGEIVGRTPLSGELAVTPGEHRVTVARGCYRPAERTVAVTAGARLAVELDPVVDSAALGRCGGRLRLLTGTEGLTVTIDGELAPNSRGALELPAGSHRIRAERSGFLPLDTTVSVPRGGEAVLDLSLRPTPEALAEARRRARTRRLLGGSSLVVGGGTVAGFAVFLADNARDIDAAQADYDAVVAETERGSGRRCDPLDPAYDEAECQADLDRTYDALDERQDLTKWGYVGLGLGGALVVTGTLVIATTRAHPRGAERAASAPVLQVSPSGLGLTVPW